MSNNNSKTIDIKDRIVSNQTHGVEDITCGGSLDKPIHKLSKKIEKSIFQGVSISTPTEKERDFIYRDEDDNVMVVDKIAGESIKQWEKIESMDDLEYGQEYLFVFETNGIAFNGSLSSLDVDGNIISVEITDGVIPYTDDNKDSFFVIDEIDGGISIQSESGYYIGRTQNSNGMNVSDTTPFVNTIGFDNNGNVIITSSAGPALQKNSGGNRFRFFKSTQRPIQLYKLVDKPGEDMYSWKTLVSNDDIDVITEEELDEMLIPQCIEGNKMDCENE